jgi:small subunit ribosomal protein S11
MIERDLSNPVVRVYMSFNNLRATLYNEEENELLCISAEDLGFNAMRRISNEAYVKVAESIATSAIENGIRKVEVQFKGFSGNREAIIIALRELDIKILKIKDLTPIPHNGCRPKPTRRL